MCKENVGQEKREPESKKTKDQENESRRTKGLEDNIAKSSGGLLPPTGPFL